MHHEEIQVGRFYVRDDNFLPRYVDAIRDGIVYFVPVDADHLPIGPWPCGDTAFASWAVRELHDDEATPLQQQIDRMAAPDPQAAIRMLSSLTAEIARGPSTPPLQRALRALG